MERKAAQERLKQLLKTVDLQIKAPIQVKTFGIDEETLKTAIKSQKWG